ncbi:MAG: 30S ribosomal protein S6 [Fibrobacterales bacterium]|nr:30S ribosomal protein S6 [Fibrobacterales bacterium]MBP5188090.1 30S ribosomal protein S6 [Fibrobacterales bacterium]MBP5350741.1 30S ribosomal protein S6 [Fibrobacterales bacterium]
MRQYETMVIVDAMIAEEAIENELKKLEAKIVGNGGQMVFKDIWGKRKLAYEIRRKSHGFYAVFYYKAERNMTSLIEKDFRINENILRWITLANVPMPAEIAQAVESGSTELRRSNAEEITSAADAMAIEKEEEA